MFYLKESAVRPCEAVRVAASCGTMPAALHVLGWYMQLHPGHKIFERRKPALLDGLVQSFLTAPFFVFTELLFWLGFRKQLRAELEELILARTKALAQAKGGDKSGQDSTYTKLVASGE